MNSFRQNNYQPQSNFSQFESPQNVDGTRDFLKSNSLVAKMAFLILIIIAFIIVMRIGVSILDWMLSPSSSPMLINGMIDSKQMLIIPQDPSQSGSIPIMRSDNQSGGIEFTYSVWIYIEDLHYKQGQYRHIFHKGNDDINTTQEPYGMNFPNNAPGLYIAPEQNNLVVVMNTFNKITERILIEDIPLLKWVNVIIRCQENYLDVFINGTLSKRHNFNANVPRQNYGDIYVSMNGGFDGNTSSLKYYNYAIGTREIQNIIYKGPNLKMLDDNGNSNSKSSYDYLSLRWYFMGNKDGYNP